MVAAAAEDTPWEEEPAVGGADADSEAGDLAIMKAALPPQRPSPAEVGDSGSEEEDRAIMDHPGLAAAVGMDVPEGGRGGGRGRGHGGRHQRTILLGGAEVRRPVRDPPWLAAWRERKERERLQEEVHRRMAEVYRGGALGQFRSW